jgi:hypothetical protein
MSHFTVLVIGNDPEGQLAPFQENNMGDCPKEFLKYRYDGDYFENEEAAKVAVGDSFDPENGYWENPNRKWDWYSLGGRWAGFFKMKQNSVGIQGHHRAKDFAAISGTVVDDLPETVADQCLKSDIDFESMRNEAGLAAQNKYDLAMSFLADLPVQERWESVCSRIEDRNAARDFFWSQPRCATWKAEEQKNFRNDKWPFGWSTSPDDFLISREDYIENARNSAITTHAIIKDGKWYESGEMGWWGMVHNEKDSNVWNKEFSALIDSLPEDTLLSVYDCHI